MLLNNRSWFVFWMYFNTIYEVFLLFFFRSGWVRAFSMAILYISKHRLRKSNLAGLRVLHLCRARSILAMK